LVGLITVLQRVGYRLPQLPVAALVAHRPRRAPLLRWGVLVGRMPFILFAIYLWTRGMGNHQAIIWFMMLAYFSASFGNGVVGVPWQDIIAKSIPARLRGRFFGTMQVAAALMAVAIGFVVRWMLGPEGPGFPHNYTILFTLLALFFTISTVGCWLIREPIRPVLDRPHSLPEMAAGIPGVLRADRGFRMLVVVVTAGFGLNYSVPFYMLHAKQDLGAPDEMAGIYIWAMTLGSATSSIVWGMLNDRRGPRSVVRGACVFATLAPVLGIALAAVHSLGADSISPAHGAVVYFYGAVFACAGAAFGGFWMGATNYLFSLVGHRERPRYIGMLNLLATPGGVFPLLVGWLLTFLPFAPVLAMLAGCGTAGIYASWRMPAEPTPQ
jgi:Na+/melibiose symporter-like transporter